MKPLPMLWKRLVKEGATCPRCGSTHESVVGAVKKLEAALRPLGIEPVLETQTIDELTFQADPSESNRIWIAGKPLEEWLGARVGASQCCTVCGDLPWRTMEIGNSNPRDDSGRPDRQGGDVGGVRHDRSRFDSANLVCVRLETL